MPSSEIVFALCVVFTGAAIFATAALFARQAMIVAYIAVGALCGPGALGLVQDTGWLAGVAYVLVQLLAALAAATVAGLLVGHDPERTAAAARAMASEQPSRALAPRLLLKSVPSMSRSFRSMPDWSEASQPSSASVITSLT